MSTGKSNSTGPGLPDTANSIALLSSDFKFFTLSKTTEYFVKYLKDSTTGVSWKPTCLGEVETEVTFS